MLGSDGKRWFALFESKLLLLMLMLPFTLDEPVSSVSWLSETAAVSAADQAILSTRRCGGSVVVVVEQSLFEKCS